MSLFGKPSFTSQYGNNNFSIRNNDGTLSEQRTEPKNQQSKADAAEVINASANGLDAISNFIAPFLNGNPAQQQQQNYNPPPPPPKKKMNPLVIGGVIGGIALIILLIVLNNGKTTQQA